MLAAEEENQEFLKILAKHFLETLYGTLQGREIGQAC